MRRLRPALRVSLEDPGRRRRPCWRRSPPPAPPRMRSRRPRPRPKGRRARRGEEESSLDRQSRARSAIGTEPARVSRRHEFERADLEPVSALHYPILTRVIGFPSHSSTILGARLTRLTPDAEKRWSGRRDSNSRPSPWQGDALPLRHFRWPDPELEYIAGHMKIDFARRQNSAKYHGWGRANSNR